MRKAGLALVVVLVLGGCAAPGATSGGADGQRIDVVPLSEVEPLADPRAHEGPSTAALADREIEPVADDPEQTLPVTVTSYDRSGAREVTITDTDRVLALDLSGSLAATVWGLGLDDLLVGRDGATTFPGSEELPVVTNDGHSLNAESILRVRPTLVVTDGSVGPRDVVEQLRDVGVEVIFLERESSLEGASRLARDVGQVLGVPEEGESLAERIEQQVADVGTEVERLAAGGDERLRMVFLYLRGSAGVYYLLGEDSGADDLIRALGGLDVADELGWRDVQPLTDEAVLAADPDLVLVMTSGLESVGGVDQLLQDKPVLALTSAGKNRRFVDMADGDVLSFGPRSADVLDALARAVYAPDLRGGDG